MNRLILLSVLVFQAISLFGCKSVAMSKRGDGSVEMRGVAQNKKGSDVDYDVLGASYYSANPYVQGIYIARSLEDAIAITEGDSRVEDVLSKIDFEKEALIFAFAGTFSTGGYSIKVDSIKRTAKNKISAVFSVSSPSPDSLVTQAFTHPSIIVSLKVSKNDIIQASFK